MFNLMKTYVYNTELVDRRPNLVGNSKLDDVESFYIRHFDCMDFVQRMGLCMLD